MSTNKMKDMMPAGWMIVGDGKFGVYNFGEKYENDLDELDYWTERGYDTVEIFIKPDDIGAE